MHQVVSNVNNKIWVFWVHEFIGNLLDQDESQMTFELKHVEAWDTFYIIVI